MSSLVAMLSLLATPGASAKDLIFWTNGNENTVTFANLDDSGGFGEVHFNGITPSAPEGVAIDPATGRIYWANEGTNTISFANFDGSGAGNLNLGSATVNDPFGVAVDPAAGKIFWSDSQGTTISFANLDGSGGGNFFTGSATVSDPIGVTVDPAAGKLYWANWMANKISFAFLNGTGGGDLSTTGATVNTPEGIALDDATGKIYWANQVGNKISYASLNGTGGGDLVTGAATVSDPSGVAVDPVAGKIYWANQAGGSVSFANLDGSGGGDLSITGSTSTNASMPALLETPVAAGTPTLTGGFVAPTTLSCSRGDWAADLLDSLLYRAPQNYSYSWTENGSPIAGAISSSITAGSAGVYSCQVTATNFAGSTSQTSSSFALAAPTATTTSITATTAPPSASATTSVKGTTVMLKITCHGVAGQSCAGRLTLTVHEHERGHSTLAVTAGKHQRIRVKKVTVGSGSYVVLAGATQTVSVTLNATGRRLLEKFGSLHVTLTFTEKVTAPNSVSFHRREKRKR